MQVVEINWESSAKTSTGRATGPPHYHLTAFFVTHPTHAASLPGLAPPSWLFCPGEVGSRARLAVFRSGNECAPGQLAILNCPPPIIDRNLELEGVHSYSTIIGKKIESRARDMGQSSGRDKQRLEPIDWYGILLCSYATLVTPMVL